MYRLSLLGYAEAERVNLSRIPSRNGGEILWSNKLFKMWKKDFHKTYQEKYNRSFKQDFPIAQQRCSIYEGIFGIDGSGILGETQSIENTTEESTGKVNTILETMSDWKCKI